MWSDVLGSLARSVVLSLPQPHPSAGRQQANAGAAASGMHAMQAAAYM